MAEPRTCVRDEARPRQAVLSTTACHSCRSLKIRCSRGSPTCSRCLKKKLACVYPEPPNRRLLAARRSGRDISGFNASSEETVPSADSLSAARTSDQNVNDMSFAELLSSAGTAPFPLSSEFLPVSPVRAGPDPDAVPQVTGSLHDYNTTQERRSLPEREIGLLLIEVYFSRMFSASLLYNHKEFVECYCAGTLPKHILLSAFAISSLFCRASPAETCGKISPLGELKSLRDRGREWAQWASELVLASSDTPTLAHVCSCDVLSLYWFALGETERSMFHATVSQTSLHLLNRKTKLGEIDAQLWSPHPISKDRVRWACFVKSCITESAPGCHVLDLELDTKSMIERGFPQPDRLDSVSTTCDGFVDWLIWDETFSQTSVIYMLEAFRLWRKTKEYVRKLEESSYQSYLTTFFELDGSLQQFQSSLPSEFKSENLMSRPYREPLQRNAFFILSIYHLSMIFLHSSMVPALSLSTAGKVIPPTVVKIASKTATTHAKLFAKMTRDYLKTTPEIAKIPSFVGYCAFVTGMVLSAVMTFIGSERGQGVRRDGAVCTLLLWELKVYWPTLQCFYQDLETHFRLSEFDYTSLLNNNLLDFQAHGSPKTTDINDSSVAAFIAASCYLTYSPKCEFIHRPYSDDHDHTSTTGTSPDTDISNSYDRGRSQPINTDSETISTYASNFVSSSDQLPMDLDLGLSTNSWTNLFTTTDGGIFG